ncbi:uncharacterized protein LOC125177631 [Hyalella azteca]|uniref:Uncharacterized protein LOC125177631 n=1 Tax=Hyalella azteca TaxID=294128 RepID=A0A979FFM6_HYAAZ|nr:uncharacterized protein LOC125177631 [Hyalella azteca]
MLSPKAAAFSVEALMSDDKGKNSTLRTNSNSRSTSPSIKDEVLFTDSENGWLSMRGKECKVFPFKVQHSTGNPSPTSFSKSSTSRLLYSEKPPRGSGINSDSGISEILYQNRNGHHEQPLEKELKCLSKTSAYSQAEADDRLISGPSCRDQPNGLHQNSVSYPSFFNLDNLERDHENSIRRPRQSFSSDSETIYREAGEFRPRRKVKKLQTMRKNGFVSHRLQGETSALHLAQNLSQQKYELESNYSSGDPIRHFFHPSLSSLNKFICSLNPHAGELGSPRSFFGPIQGPFEGNPNYQPFPNPLMPFITLPDLKHDINNRAPTQADTKEKDSCPTANSTPLILDENECASPNVLRSILQAQHASGPETVFRACDDLQRLVSGPWNDRLSNRGACDVSPQGEEEVVRLVGGVTVQLLQSDLWRKFHSHGTEMIITKIGRRMFPVLRIRISGLDPDKMYLLYADMQPVDNKRYRYVYQSSRWLVAGVGENQSRAEAKTDRTPKQRESIPVPDRTPIGTRSRKSDVLYNESGTPNSKKISIANIANSDQGIPTGDDIHSTTPIPSDAGIPSTEDIPRGAGDGSKIPLYGEESGAGLYMHPDSPALGSCWNGAHSIAFDKLKLTNSSTSSGQICLHSMQKYQPRIWIQEYQDAPEISDSLLGTKNRNRESCRVPGQNSTLFSFPATLAEVDGGDVGGRRKGPRLASPEWLTKIDRQTAQVAVFPVTSFITVTAYQNQQVVVVTAGARLVKSDA